MTNLGTGSSTYAANPSVVSVFMNVANSPGTFDSFSLSVVPEPSTFALIGVSLIGVSLAWRARSRKARC